MRPSEGGCVRMHSERPSILHLLSSFNKSQRMFSKALKFLIQHFVDYAPPTAVPILTPICYLAARFDNSLRRAMETFHFLLVGGKYCILDGENLLKNQHFLNFLDAFRQVRDQLVPAIEAKLVEIEPLLESELRGQERLLRFLKQIPGFWSGKIDLLDDIPDIMFSVRSSCKTIVDCLEHFERYAGVMKACFQDVDWVARHEGYPELMWCLHHIELSVMQQIHGMRFDESLRQYLPDMRSFWERWGYR
ncbi:hypothetical protein DFS33DRAFT_1490668 [Desarmillaria ectypa]|nr:hypothetical protein DFS33DRAFT_136072 [Desarmillaria ectypa]KAK0200243.1 hypothetical protein DFS33DRAFT_1490668 [Desarmillaria ectypa]